MSHDEEVIVTVRRVHRPEGAPPHEVQDSGSRAVGSDVARKAVASAYGADQIDKVSGSGSTYHVTLKSGKALQVKVDGSTGTVIDPSDGHTVATHTVSEAAHECGCPHAHPPSVPVSPCDEEPAPAPVALAIAGASEKSPKLSWKKIRTGEYAANGRRGSYLVHKLFEVWVVALDRHLLTPNGVRGNVENCETFNTSTKARRFAEVVDAHHQHHAKESGASERVMALAEKGPERGSIRVKRATAASFRSAFEQAFHASPFTHHVTHYTVAELERMLCYMTDDGRAGVAVKNHGDGRVEATALFNAGAAPGAGLYLLAHVIEHAGVNYVECYGPVLNQLYAKLGFRDVDKSAFKAEYAAPGWDTQRFDHPDYHVMRFA
jgi:hypothetical protein